MNINQLIDQFESVKKEISLYFEVPIYDGFDDMRDIYWSLENRTLTYEKDGDEYALCIQLAHHKEELSLFGVRDSGLNFWIVVDNAKRKTK